MKICFLILFSAGTLTACRDDSVAGPFGLRTRERPGGGSVAAAIRRDALNHHYCPSVPTPGTGWTVRTLTKPAGRVSLPPALMAVPAPTSEVTFFAPEMPEDSPLSRSAIITCRMRVGSVEGVAYLISQRHPVQSGDSVHLVFLQVVVPGEQAVRAGAFATTRALRDSLLSALVAFHPDLR